MSLVWSLVLISCALFRVSQQQTAAPPQQCCLPRDCADIMAGGGTTSGVYTIYVGSFNTPVQAYCDQTTDRGGWTVIQRRTGAAQSFNQTWAAYAQGFGNPAADYWLGNRYIHGMTTYNSEKKYYIRLEFNDWTNTTAGTTFVVYNNFVVASEIEKFKLVSVGTYIPGTVYPQAVPGDSLTPHVGYYFSTVDNDNDACGCNCAIEYSAPSGGWWFMACFICAPNGAYLNVGTSPFATGIQWSTWKGYYYSLQSFQIKIRPADV